MSVTSPPTLTDAPTSPDRDYRSTFTARSIALDDWRKNYNVPESTALAANVFSNATDAAANATIAANAALVVGATVWVSGTTYVIGDARYSPINLNTYRRRTAGGGTTDPSSDPTNWLVSMLNSTIVGITGTMAQFNTAVTDANLAITGANTFTAAQIGTVQALSVSSNAVAVNLALANDFSLTLQATTGQTLSNPTNVVAGQAGQIVITQNGTPSTLAYGSYWIQFDGTTPTVSSTASAINLLSYYVVDSTHVFFSLAKHGVA